MMSKSNTPTETMPPSASGQMLRAMVGIGSICALLIVLVYEGTLPMVEKNKAAALEKAIFKVIPGTVNTATYQLTAEKEIVAAGDQAQGANLIYAGFDEAGQLLGVAVAGAGQGYADVIRILYGYDIDKQAIVGMHVLESKETPGLGDKIEKDPNFLANFIALDVSLNENQEGLKNPITLVKSGQKTQAWEIDGITGATISSRAISEILGKSTVELVPILYKNKAIFSLKQHNE